MDPMPTGRPKVGDLAGAFKDASALLKWGLATFVALLVLLAYLVQAWDILRSLDLFG